jgi:pyoverdine/dityrosine biosynthesis protein Dit1
MKKIPNREIMLDKLLILYPECPICKRKFTPELNFALLKLEQKFARLSNEDILQAMRLQIHHRMPDTQKNIEKYPLFINSERNLYPLHALCHFDNKFYGQINDHEAEIIEKELEEAKASVNNSDK